MEKLNYSYNSTPAQSGEFGKSSGVVNSGNLEILVLANQQTDTVNFTIGTTVNGFAAIWDAVCRDFSEKFAVGGLNFILHDNGATPGVVALRLRQAYENYCHSEVSLTATTSYVELTPRQRIAAIVDTDSFSEILPPQELVMSPRLGDLGLLTAFDDGVVIGDAQIDGQAVAIIAQQANFMGGAVGEVNGAKISGMCLRAQAKNYAAVVLLLDSGGVRLQEANAGEIAISEVIRSIFAVRADGVPVVAVVAGKNGAFGGIGITAACCDHLLITELGRSGVSGPEVIETVMGVEEYDSKDRALVWRTCGGRQRALLGQASYCANSLDAINHGLRLALASGANFTRENINQRQQLLQQQVSEFAELHDACEIWDKLGIANPPQIPEINDTEFLTILEGVNK